MVSQQLPSVSSVTHSWLEILPVVADGCRLVSRPVIGRQVDVTCLQNLSLYSCSYRPPVAIKKSAGLRLLQLASLWFNTWQQCKQHLQESVHLFSVNVFECFRVFRGFLRSIFFFPAELTAVLFPVRTRWTVFTLSVFSVCWETLTWWVETIFICHVKTGWMKIRLSLLDLENIYFWLLHLGPIFTLLCLYYSRASLVCMVARCVHGYSCDYLTLFRLSLGCTMTSKAWETWSSNTAVLFEHVTVKALRVSASFLFNKTVSLCLRADSAGGKSSWWKVLITHWEAAVLV